jgi:CRISPR-associated protein Cmr6
MYSATKLIEALARQHRQRKGKSDLFKSGTFILDWRVKVGSFPHPDNETIVSAGEPCGSWEKDQWTGAEISKKREIGVNLCNFEKLPLYGYIPAASLRGMVRAWASKHPKLREKMNELLGYQTSSKIVPGKVDFLDAFPSEATKLTLDITNPQQNFQVFHERSPSPFSLYTLDNKPQSIKDNKPQSIEIKIAICGRSTATPEDVRIVWEWLEQALYTQGIGGRTAAGYGQIKSPPEYQPNPELIASLKTQHCRTFNFILDSQGCGGIDATKPNELRPTHWRGWLRSWLLRFFLGVMSENNAKLTVAELMGSVGEGKSK